MIQYLPCHCIQFGPNKRSEKFYVLSCTVKSNIHYHSIITMTMTRKDILSSFCESRNNGYGIVLQIHISNLFDRKSSSKMAKTANLIKWIDVLQSRMTGLQVWAHLDPQRDFTSILSSKCQVSKNSDAHLLSILSYLYEEIYCDKIAMMQLLSKYYMIMNKKRREHIAKMNDNKNVAKGPINTNNNGVSVNLMIENAFRDAIVQCYTDFTEITSPILNRDQINHLVSIYKSQM